MSYYVIEHASRGVFVGFKDGKPKFKWSVLRSKGKRYRNEAEATHWLGRIKPLVKGKPPYLVFMAYSKKGEKKCH